MYHFLSRSASAAVMSVIVPVVIVTPKILIRHW